MFRVFLHAPNDMQPVVVGDVRAKKANGQEKSEDEVLKEAYTLITSTYSRRRIAGYAFECVEFSGARRQYAGVIV